MDSNKQPRLQPHKPPPRSAYPPAVLPPASGICNPSLSIITHPYIAVREASWPPQPTTAETFFDYRASQVGNSSIESRLRLVLKVYFFSANFQRDLTYELPRRIESADLGLVLSKRFTIPDARYIWTRVSSWITSVLGHWYDTLDHGMKSSYVWGKEIGASMHYIAEYVYFRNMHLQHMLQLCGLLHWCMPALCYDS